MPPQGRGISGHVADAHKTEATIQTLMGKEVEPRFRFIMEHAPKVEEVDV